MEIPRSVRLARLCAMIVLFILSSVSVGYVAVRMITDRVLPAEKAATVQARASTHSSAALGAQGHVSSPFMNYGASATHVKLDGDDDADDYAVAPALGSSTLALLSTPTTGGSRDFTGSSKNTRSGASTGGGGFAIGGGIGAGAGAYGGVSGSATRSGGTKSAAHTSSTSPSRPSSGHTSSGGGSATNSGSTTTGPAADPPAPTTTTPASTVTTTGTATASGRLGGVTALSVSTPLGGGSSPAPTPEPISLLLIASGLGGAAGFRRLFH